MAPFISIYGPFIWLIYVDFIGESPFFHGFCGLLIALNGPNRRYCLAFCRGKQCFLKQWKKGGLADEKRGLTWCDHGKFVLQHPANHTRTPTWKKKHATAGMSTMSTMNPTLATSCKPCYCPVVKWNAINCLCLCCNKSLGNLHHESSRWVCCLSAMLATYTQFLSKHTRFKTQRLRRLFIVKIQIAESTNGRSING